jgi:hypothetical protein
MKMKKLFISLCLLIFVSSCSEHISIAQYSDEVAPIYPDYRDVTIPANIAPLNFMVETDADETALLIADGTDTLTVKGAKGNFAIPSKRWTEMLSRHKGDSLSLVVCRKEANGWVAYRPFAMHVANEPIDSHLAYRLIAPGYSLWAKMGIYQRNLETYEEKAIYVNRVGMGNCVNCHSFKMQNPDQMLFHIRSHGGGTFVYNNGVKEKLDTKTDHTISNLVYPSWHASGKYVAFSVNKTFQLFHTKDPKRIEVYDEASDVVVYDVEKHEIISTPILSTEGGFETFPTFSPDGKWLYFCVSKAVEMPNNYAQARYSLCRTSFNPETRQFGEAIDTLYSAEKQGGSVSFPRVSPNGEYLVFTLSNYGQFSIWHKEADLYCLNLQTNHLKPLAAWNSDDTESYHSWSSNGRWMVFSSRRDDGLYTRPYIGYMDAEGNPKKAFMLPQEAPKDYYTELLYSYNIPELITGEVDLEPREVGDWVWSDDVIKVK